MRQITVDLSKVQSMSCGAIRCDGTIGASLYMQNNEVIDLDGLTLKQCELLENAVDRKQSKISIDARLLKDSPENSSIETFCRRNGIMQGRA